MEKSTRQAQRVTGGVRRDKPKASRHPVEPLEKSCKPGSATVETLLAIQTELDKGKFWQVPTFTHHISAVSSDGRSLWHCLEQPLCPSRILLPLNTMLWQPNTPSGGYFSGTISTSWPVPWPIFVPSSCWCLCFVFNFARMQPQWEQQTNKRGNCAVAGAHNTAPQRDGHFTLSL